MCKKLNQITIEIFVRLWYSKYIKQQTDIMSSWNIAITPYGTENETTCGMLKNLKPDDFVQSIDQGGHGGAMKIKRSINGEHVFLKPKTPDGTEARNYKIISTDPKVARWMPRVYGEAKINGRSFLIMENIRKSVNGRELPQLGDIKLAGQVEGLNNPIGNSKEMMVTRGGQKTFITKLWMKFISAIAPGYLITNGGCRLLNYIQGKEILKDSLRNIPTRKLNILLTDLIRMRDDINDSGIALIGASIALIYQENGSVKAVLIDPAHIQCSNKLNEQVVKVVGEQESKKVFFECSTSCRKNQYHLQKTSNIVALEAIITTLGSILASRGKNLQQTPFVPLSKRALPNR